MLSGKLGHKEFNFSTYNYNYSNVPYNSNGCGTSGCAIGECPIVFPNEWEFRMNEYFEFLPRLKNRHLTIVGSGMEFFKLNKDEYQHLFVPNFQTPIKYGGKTIDKNATKEEVATNILEFCKKIENNLKV